MCGIIYFVELKSKNSQYILHILHLIEHKSINDTFYFTTDMCLQTY